MCSLFTFMFTADCYARRAYCWPHAGAWLIKEIPIRFPARDSLPGSGMGIYQAYLCLALGILVMGLFWICWRKTAGLPMFSERVKAFVVACISVVIYTIVSRIVYPQLDAYNGLDQMGKIDLINLSG